MNGSRGTLVVVGGGIAGISAAVEASEAGCDVVLVEKEPFLGGRVVRAHQYFPKMCPPQCGLEINLRRVRTSPRIRCLTLSEVEKVEGDPGDLRVTIRRHPRRVTERCTACGACVDVCPAERPDAFNLGMGRTKAIYLPHATAHPMRLAIDPEACLGQECAACVPACPFDAIELGQDEETLEVQAGAVILATGWEPFDASRLSALGYGVSPDVITNVMMERLAAPAGPTGGAIVRPSDGKPVSSVAFVQCAGSRDENYQLHCSGVCCMGTLKQTRYVRSAYPDADIHVFYIDIRAPGRLEDFYAETQKDEKVHLVKGKVGRVDILGDGTLEVHAEDVMAGTSVSRTVDLVVLATGITPADTGGIDVPGGLLKDEHGFLAREQALDGLMAVGCAARPTDVSTCVRDATGAVAATLHLFAE